MIAARIIRTEGLSALIRQSLHRLTQEGSSRYDNFFDSPVLRQALHDRSIWQHVKVLLFPAERRAQRDHLMAIWCREAISGRSRFFEPGPLTRNKKVEGGSKVSVFAFYLPQFHPFPENDEWWGIGFTEWTNVTKSGPQFLGHNQPRLPGDLSFYDLRLAETWMNQWALAEAYGIDGFCVYYYWFSGKSLMTRALETWKCNTQVRSRIFLCWANENWTRAWDGLDKEVLICQQYQGEADDLSFIQDIAPYLADERYIRLDGKPMLAVYNVETLPDPTATAARWREYWRSNYQEDLFLYCVHSPVSRTRIVPPGFDAAIEFPPAGADKATYACAPPYLDLNFVGGIFDYEKVARSSKDYEPCSAPRSRGVMPGWDNTARRSSSASVFVNGSPHAFSDWLHDTIRYSRWFPGETNRAVFVNAWNEWAEGAYLEPDHRNGHAYGNAARAARSAWDSDPLIIQVGADSNADGAVIAHVHYPELIPELDCCLKLLSRFDIFFSCSSDNVARQLAAAFPRATILLVPNRGRDISGLLAICEKTAILKYPVAVKLHTKKSLHRTDGEDWRKYLFTHLVPSEVRIQAILAAFKENPRLCAIAPTGHRIRINDDFYAGSNAGLLAQLYKLSDISPRPDDVFVAGSMYWFNPSALEFFPIDKLSVGDFPTERGQTDGELHHAIERFLFVPALRRGMEITDMKMAFGEQPSRNFL